MIKTDEELLLANTLSGATWSAMLAIGAAIGGFTAALFGVEVSLIADAGTFLLSAWLVAQISAKEPAPEAASSESGLLSGYNEFVEGIRYLIKRPAVGLVACVKSLAQLGNPDILIAIYAERLFPLGEEGASALGLMFMSAGLGAVAGPLIANRFNDNSLRSLQRWIGIGFVSVVFGWLIFGWAPSFPIVMLGLFVRFMGGSTCWTYSTVILQIKVPNQLLGRVSATDMAIYTLTTALGVWLTGYLLDTFQLAPARVAVIFGLSSILAIVIWFITQPMLNRDAESAINN